MKINLFKGYLLSLFAISIFSGLYSISFAIDIYDIKEGGPPIIADEGVIFRFKADGIAPRYIQVSGDFNNWEEAFLMKKNSHGVFVYYYNKLKEKGIVLKDGRYNYRYLIDGVWIKDPLNDKITFDQYGTELSYFEVPVPIIIAKQNPIKFKENNYIFYYHNDKAREVYLAGDFNNWNPYSLPMKKNKSGLWELELDIPSGSYAYVFIVDGVYRKDPLGKLVFDRFDKEYTLLKIPPN